MKVIASDSVDMGVLQGDVLDEGIGRIYLYEEQFLVGRTFLDKLF